MPFRIGELMLWSGARPKLLDLGCECLLLETGLWSTTSTRTSYCLQRWHNTKVIAFNQRRTRLFNAFTLDLYSMYKLVCAFVMPTPPASALCRTVLFNGTEAYLKVLEVLPRWMYLYCLLMRSFGPLAMISWNDCRLVVWLLGATVRAW